MPEDQLTMAPGVLDEEPIGIVPAGDDPRQVAARDRRGHGGLLMLRYAGDGVDGYSEPRQHGRVGVIAGHGQDSIHRDHLAGRGRIGDDFYVRRRDTADA
jgi:hypothetical protein